MDIDTKQLRRLADAGLQLIPLHSWDAKSTDAKGRKRDDGKRPLDASWTTRPYDTLKVVERAEHTNSNVGVRLTAEQVVLDWDPRADTGEYSDPAINAFVEFVLWHGLNPDDFPQVETGGGGLHIYMAKPADVAVLGSLENYPGVEFKTKGQQVVAPGSVHPNGKIYVLVEDFNDIGSPDQAPKHLLDAIVRTTTSAAVTEGGQYDQELIAAMLEGLDPGDFGEHDKWLKLMMACHHASAGAAREEFIEWSTKDPVYQDDAWIIGRRWDSLHAKRDGATVTYKSLNKFLCDVGRGDLIPSTAAEDFGDDDPAMADEPSGGELPQGPLTGMNEKFWAVLNAGRFRIMWLADDPEEPGRRFWKSLAKPDFEAYLSNRKIEKPAKNKKGETVTETTPLAKAWLDWGHRRQAEDVVFVPDREVPGSLNLWTGWGVDRGESGECRLMLEMIRDVLCSGVQEHYDYLMRWMAWKVQNPGEPNEVAVVFKGAKGVGKTTLGESLAKIFGSHGLVLSSVEQIAGRFSGHLATVCFLFGDEIFWGGNKTHEGTLKKIITDREVMREAKGVDMVRARNRISLMMATNEKWAVPASLEGERRFFVLNVSSERKVPDSAPADHPNRLYWNAVHDEIRDGGRAAFLRHLMAMDLGRFHPRSAVPETEGMSEQKVHSLDPLQRWLLSATELGVLPGYPSTKDQKQLRRTDWELKQDWSQVEAHDPPRLDPTSVMENVEAHWSKLRSPVPGVLTVKNMLEEFGWQSRKSNGVVTWRPPTLEQARQEWRRRLPGLTVFEAPPEDDEWDS
ncbi:MAG: bifunctional DNA primase/polymerase [Hyphomonadaceae bacterium]|nr:bifunctional DNA primase/polymerase [Hyphomonadaceae bacterium]